MPVFYVFGRGDLDVEPNVNPRGGHQASPPKDPQVDFSTATAFESFSDLLDTVTAVEKDGGVRVWLPQKILAAPGSLGSSLDTDKLLRVCLDCVGSAEAENPPSMTTLAIAASAEGGAQPPIFLRTQRALLQATVGFLWRATDHGGMVSASGLVVLPTARPSARCGCSTSAERRHPASPMSRRAAPECGRESATKRSRVDSGEHGVKKMKSSSGGSGPMRSGAQGVWGKARPGGGATGRPPKMLLTIVALPEQVRGCACFAACNHPSIQVASMEAVGAFEEACHGSCWCNRSKSDDGLCVRIMVSNLFRQGVQNVHCSWYLTKLNFESAQTKARVPRRFASGETRPQHKQLHTSQIMTPLGCRVREVVIAFVNFCIGMAG